MLCSVPAFALPILIGLGVIAACFTAAQARRQHRAGFHWLTGRLA